MLRFFTVIMIALLAFLLYIMFFGKNINYSNGYHCGWNEDVYIKCGGEEKMDFLDLT